MGAYREQLLREACGGKGAEIHGASAEERPSGTLAMFKLRFTVCLLLFAGFAYLNYTGGSVFGVTAERIVEAVTDNTLQARLAELADSWK